MYQFQPCGLCGNCQAFLRSEKDPDGSVVVPSDCKVKGEPKFVEGRAKEERGHWKCETFENARGKKRRERRNKPHQRRLNRHERLAIERRI